MNVKFTTGGWGRGTEVQSPRSNVQSRRRPARVHPIPRRAVRCAARGLCTALKRGVNESGVCESCDNCDSFTNLSSREMRRALRRRVSLPESAVVPAQSKVGIARWSNPRDLQSSQDLQREIFRVERNTSFRALSIRTGATPVPLPKRLAMLAGGANIGVGTVCYSM